MSAEIIASVIAQGERLATHSWEYGTFAEALLEWYNPSNSVFGDDPFLGGKIPVLPVDQTRSLSYAEPQIWTNSTTLVDGDGKYIQKPLHSVTALLTLQKLCDKLCTYTRNYLPYTCYLLTHLPSHQSTRIINPAIR